MISKQLKLKLASSLLLLGAGIISCNREGTASNKPINPHSDTIRTIVDYTDGRNYIDRSFAFKIVKDTFTIVGDIDLKKVWKKDSIYFVPTQQPIKDSLGKIKLDSLKRPMYNIIYVECTNRFILNDFNVNYPIK